MGGSGSGSWCAKGYDTVDEAAILSVSEVRRSACLKESELPESVSIRYDVDKSGDRVSDVLRFVRTYPHFGGVRLWFRCPCGRRAVKLYRPMHELHFKCRTCHGLVYQSQRETRAARLMRRSQKLIERLDPRAECGWRRSEADRPKGMHRRTYDRLSDEELAFRLQGLRLLLGRGATRRSRGRR